MAKNSGQEKRSSHKLTETRPKSSKVPLATDHGHIQQQRSYSAASVGVQDESEPTANRTNRIAQDGLKIKTPLKEEASLNKPVSIKDTSSSILVPFKDSDSNCSSMSTSRSKRQAPVPTLYILPVIADLYTVARISGYCNLLVASGPAFVLNQITNDANAACEAACCPIGLPQVPDLYTCNLDADCIFALPDVVYLTAATCAARTIVDLQTLCDNYCPPVITTTTTTATTPYDTSLIFLLKVGAPIVAAGVVSAGALAVTPDLPIVTSQGIPPGNDVVGCPWGGGLPHGRSVITRLALTLVPAGKTPVAIFPSFHKTRTRKAVCVIFAEGSSDESNSHSSRYSRFKRSMGRRNLRRKHRGPSFLSRQLKQLNYKLREARDGLMMVLKCTRATISRVFSGDKRRRRLYGASRRSKYDNEANSFDDCFDDLDEPRYGFVCRVRLVENQSCVLGVTCRGVPDDEDDDLVNLFDPAFDIQSTMDYSGRQSGEGFSSAGPVDCRVRSTGACG